MRLNLDMNILRHMSDGVLVLDRHAKITAYNKVAEPWAPRCQAMSVGLKRLIDEERQGRLALPLFFDLQMGAKNLSSQRAEAWLCKNGRNEYAIFVVAQKQTAPAISDAPSPSERRPNPLALLGGEVREQLSALRGHLHSYFDPQSAAPEALVQHCKKIEQLMQEVTDLSQLQEHDAVFASERMSISELVESTLLKFPPNANQATVELRTSTDKLGPVYGNGIWLGYALKTLISSLVAGAPPRASLELVVRQMGDFVILTGRANSTRPGHPATVLSKIRPGVAEATDGQEANLQLMICKRIIELHAGQLRLSLMPADTLSLTAPACIESFTLTLMTSVPANERSRASCADCRHVRQEIAYASDMALLISKHSNSLFDRSLSL